MKYAILLLILAVLYMHYHHPHKSVGGRPNAKVAAVDTYVPDSRTAAEWIYQCAPREAHKLGTSIYGYWCTTSANPLDRPYRLPAHGWEWSE